IKSHGCNNFKTGNVDAIETQIIRITIQMKNAVDTAPNQNKPVPFSPPIYWTKSICKKSTLLAMIAVIYITANAARDGTSIVRFLLYTASRNQRETRIRRQSSK